MEQVLLVVQVLVAIALIGMVLIQRSDSDGFGLGSGSGSNLLSGRSSANLMTRTTAILAAAFLLNSLALSVITARAHKTSIVETIERQQSDVPAVPLAGADKTDKAVKVDAADKAEKKTAPAVPVAGKADAVKVDAAPAAATADAKVAAKKTTEKPAADTDE